MRPTALDAGTRPGPRGADPAARRAEETGVASKPLDAFFARESDEPLADAFAAKRVIHPFVGLSPVPPSEWEETWRVIAAAPRTGRSVAYLHIPFCANHCLFCGFYQNPWREADGSDYVDALVDHLRRDRDLPYQAEGPIRAAYFGGGTPTALSARDLARLIEAARRHLPLAADCEITVEGRAHDFDLEKARAAFAAGANRVSIGVQTFDDRLRRRIGRKTPRAALIGFLERLVDLDQGAIVIDLIYGLPDQTMAIWEADVRAAIDIGLDGIDLYALNLIPGTPLHASVDKGKFAVTPAGELGAYYRRGAELLDAARWQTLSTSHWRSGSRERNLYNLEVKSGASCLAFGAGAGGFLGGYSYRIVPDVADYRNRIARGESPVGGLMRQSGHHRLFNCIKGDMERGRLDRRAFAAMLRQSAARDPGPVADPLLAQWERAGLLVRDDRWIDLTLAGRFWQVAMTQNLLEWLDQALRGADGPTRQATTNA
jgi:oxygen-independent coproporphyrinogen-3 oxidase